MRNRGLVFCLMFIFLSGCVSAELNLVITAESNSDSSDFFASTNENSDVSFDAYDLEYPPFPETVRKIYSSVGTKKLIMDSWPNADRTLWLVYERGELNQEELSLKFSGEILRSYKLVLKDYGNDSGYSNLNGLTVVSEGKEYFTKVTGARSYFELIVDYLYCGDGVCTESEGEDCFSCSNDCGVCEGGDVLISNSLNKFYFPNLDELGRGFSGQYGIDSGFVVNFQNKTHWFKVSSINNLEEKVTISSEIYFLEIKKGDSSFVDLNGDLNNDMEIKVNSISDEVDLFVHASDITGFFEVPGEERIIRLDERDVSIFDEMYNEGSVFGALRIVFPIVLLFVGVSMFIFGLFLLLKRKHFPKQERGFSSSYSGS